MNDGPLRRAVLWVLLYADRRLLALLISLVIFAVLLLIGTVWEFEMERLVTETRAVQTLFNTLLGGIILFVSVVLSVNTAALAQEFEPLRVKLGRIEDSIEYQIELEDLVEEGVSPAGLRPFLEFVIDGIRSAVTDLRGAEVPTEDDRFREDLLRVSDEVDSYMSTIERRIEEADPRTSVVLLSALDYPSARHINEIRRLQSRHGSVLSPSNRESLDGLLQQLTMFVSGREFFTTLYFKRELRDLSLNLLVLALPVIVFTSYVLLAIDAGLFPRLPFVGGGHRLFYVSFAFVVALSPYVLLTSFMFRILSVSRHALESNVIASSTDVRP